MMKLKDKKIEILAVTNTINENGYAVESLQPIGLPVWAYYRQLSGKEYYSANAEQVQEECLFQINYRADLSTRHVICFKGVLYDITRVDDYEGYKADLTLYLQAEIKRISNHPFLTGFLARNMLYSIMV